MRCSTWSTSRTTRCAGCSTSCTPRSSASRIGAVSCTARSTSCAPNSSRRLKAGREAGEDVISGRDVDRLIDILANDLRGVSRFDVAAAPEDDADELLMR